MYEHFLGFKIKVHSYNDYLTAPQTDLKWLDVLSVFISAGRLAQLPPLSDKLTGVLLPSPQLQNTCQRLEYGKENHRIANLVHFSAFLLNPIHVFAYMHIHVPIFFDKFLIFQ